MNLGEETLASSKVLKKEVQLSDCIEFEENDLEIEIKTMKSLHEEGLTGGRWTFLVLKNSSSFIIGNNHNWLKLYEDNNQLYFENLRDSRITIKGLVYIDFLDCYLLGYNDAIYRKDVDDKAPYLYINLSCGQNSRDWFTYSKLNQRLIAPYDFDGYSVDIGLINLKKKQMDMVFFGGSTNEVQIIQDLKMFGKKEDKFVYLNSDLKLVLLWLNFRPLKICVKSEYKIEKIEDRRESGLSVEVCGQGKYIIAALRLGGARLPFHGECFHSRMIILELRGHLFVRLDTLDQSNQIGLIMSIRFWRRVGKHVLWVGLSKRDGFVYDFNTESRQVRELNNKRFRHQEVYPLKMHSLGDEDWYYSGGRGRLMALSLSI